MAKVVNIVKVVKLVKVVKVVKLVKTGEKTGLLDKTQLLACYILAKFQINLSGR